MKKNRSLLGRIAEVWVSYKAGKGMVKLLSGPALIGGVGYVLYRALRPSAAV